jgi:hypothetical protein
MKELDKLPLQVTKADKAFALNLVNAIKAKQDSRYSKNYTQHRLSTALQSDSRLKRKFGGRN